MINCRMKEWEHIMTLNTCDSCQFKMLTVLVSINVQSTTRSYIFAFAFVVTDIWDIFSVTRGIVILRP